MRYQSKSSVSYMFRNFLQLVYVSLPAALLMAFAAFMYKPTAEIRLLVQLFGGGVTMDEYPTLLLNTLSLLRYGKYWWIFLLAMLVMSFAACLLVVKIDRHMRTGHMPVMPLRNTFGIYHIMLLYVLCTVLATELVTLIAVGLSVLMRFFGNATAIVSVTLALSLFGRVLCAYVFALLLMAFPLRYSENYRFNRALSYSARVMFRRKRQLWLVAVLYPIARLAMLGVAYLLEPYKLDILVYAITFLLAVTYIPCLSYKQYYDEVGGERRDLERLIFG